MGEDLGFRNGAHVTPPNVGRWNRSGAREGNARLSQRWRGRGLLEPDGPARRDQGYGMRGHGDAGGRIPTLNPPPHRPGRCGLAR